MPRKADVFFGAGEFAEDGFDVDKGVEPGDIVYGCYHPVPPARPEYAGLEVGVKVTAKVFDPDIEGFCHLPAVHYGGGITLLDRDHDKIQPLLFDIFESKQCCWIIFIKLRLSNLFGQTLL